MKRKKKTKMNIFDYGSFESNEQALCYSLSMSYAYLVLSVNFISNCLRRALLDILAISNIKKKTQNVSGKSKQN